jgi:hypothetical protein
MTLESLTVLSFRLMCENELKVAAFAHPSFNRQSLEVHIRMRSSLAALFGQVMPVPRQLFLPIATTIFAG